jgi:hypothetical protein
VVVPASARLGDRIGLRRLYVISMLMFSAFSALCGMAGGLDSMIFYRILQAIPGGVIPVTCLTILYKMVPKEKIGETGPFTGAERLAKRVRNESPERSGGGVGPGRRRRLRAVGRGGRGGALPTVR